MALTASGLQLIESLMTEHVANLQRILAGLDPQGCELLHSLTGKLLAGLLEVGE